jgi:hypothetical protein
VTVASVIPIELGEDLAQRCERLYERGLPPGDSTGWPAVDAHFTVAPQQAAASRSGSTRWRSTWRKTTTGTSRSTRRKTIRPRRTWPSSPRNAYANHSAKVRPIG